MITSQKIIITFSIVISLISCSEKDINNPDSENLESDNLDFVVYAKTDDNPYSLFQINVSELGEISESNLSTELGLRSENTTSIPLPIHSTGNLFVFKEHQPPNKLHIKDLSTNIYTTINTLCDISLDNILYNIKSTDNKFVLFFETLDNSYTILTIDKNLDITNCQKLPLGKVLFAEPFDYFRYGSKHVIFKMYTEGSTYIYSFNTELNQLNSVIYNQLTDSPYSNIIMDKDKFYLFMEGTYKTFDFDFNLLEESTYELEFNGGAISPIKGSHVESNKIKVDLNHISTGGYVSRPNVYDLVNKTILVNEEALISRLDNIRTNGYIQTYETDLKKERIIYGIQLLNSEFKGKILITDFDSNILDEIFVDSVPSKIQIL